MSLPPIPEVVRDFRLCIPQERERKLQVMIGQPTNSPAELHWRALLVTALRKADVYPK
jgi:hypothetical protein